ncbi:SGNH/GDSL hydrolase family protein [Methylobacterium sp. CM6257]
MRMKVAVRRHLRRPGILGLTAALCLAALGLFGSGPAQAQWGDTYQQPGNGAYYQAPPRRRSRDAYYRDDGTYGRQPRYAPQQEAPRQFYWPWEDRPQPVAPPPERTYRAPRPRSYGNTEAQRPAPAVKRRVRPARAPTPPKPAVAKTEPNVQIAVFGDSLADHLAKGLDDVFEDNADVAVVDRAKGDSGLVRKDVVDWPKIVQDYLQGNPKVRYALVMLGANDRQPIREGDETVEPLTDRWRALYRARVEALVKVFTDRKVPLIWVGLPPVQSDSLSRDLASLNDIIRDSVTKAGATYVDIWPGFVDERDRYAASGPDPEGQIAKLRTADGIYFTKAGDRKLAHFADVELKRLMGTTAPALADQPPAATVTPGVPSSASGPSLDGAGQPTDTASIDRQITAMLPSLPEPPGVPALPVKPAAGPVVPLSRPEISPGGVLLNGRPRDSDNLGTAERTLLRGNAPLPQPGRADDFRWPPG